MQQTQTTRSAFITGAGRNIGRAIALKLAGRGFNVAINGSSDLKACQSVANEINTMGGKAIVIMGDIGDRDQIKSIIQKTFDAFDTIDVLVNNAAIRPNFNFLEDSEDDWERVMNTNFKSGFCLSRACLPGMLEKNGAVLFPLLE